MALQRSRSGAILGSGRGKPVPRKSSRPASRISRQSNQNRSSQYRSGVDEAKKAARWAHVDWGKVRILGVCCCMAVLWLALWGRAFYVQIILGPEYAEDAHRNQRATELVTGRRGMITDRNGHVLARSVEARSIFVRPREVENTAETARFLAKTLNLPLKKVRESLTGEKNFVWIQRKVDPVLAEEVKAAELRGVYLTTEFERVYPFRHLAGQLLGFVDVDDKGIEGLEMAFEDSLAGQSSRQVLQRDAAGRRLYTKVGDNFDDLTGEDLRLTLDTQIQFVAENALAEGVKTFDARWAGCIVVDVPTGDILAWAEYPFFNPNRFKEYSNFTRRNKLAMDALEQGSTIKPFLMAAALDAEVVRPDTEFDCENGRWKLRNITIRDPSPHGILTAHDIIRVSSNIGVGKIGLSLGAQKYYAVLTALGFGAKSGLKLAGENKGILRSPGQWTEVDTASAAFGQSFSATGLQMAQAYLYLAAGGVRRPLRLVMDGETEKEPEERIFSEETVRQVYAMLYDVVQGEGGTGRRARIPGIHVGGKTGTAQKASGDSYGEGRVGSFAGFLPAEDPRYLIVVVFDEPLKNSYGGVVAAPVFKNIAMRTMAYHGLLPEAVQAEAKESVPPAAVHTPPRSGELPLLNPQGSILEASLEDTSPPSGKKKPKRAVTPQVVGLSVRKAVEYFAAQGLVPEIQGSGSVVIRQLPPAGAPLPPLDANGEDGALECVLWLGEKSS